MTQTNSASPEIETETEMTVKTIGKNEKKIVRAKRTRVLRKVNRGMFDLPEIIAVAFAGVALGTVVFAYFFILLPAREEFKKAEAERSQKQTQLINLQAQARQAGTNAAGTVDLVSSVDRFETNFLPFLTSGNAALYQRLNELIRANNLRNTAGPEYSSLETIDLQRAAKINEKAARDNKQQSIFPGTVVTVTVEGNYASLRRFIGNLESTRQFLIINAVEIESNGGTDATDGAALSTNALPSGEMPNNATGFQNPQPPLNRINPRLNNNPTTTTPPTAQIDAATAGGRGAVSLRLEMAAYFRRPVISPTN